MTWLVYDDKPHRPWSANLNGDNQPHSTVYRTGAVGLGADARLVKRPRHYHICLLYTPGTLQPSGTPFWKPRCPACRWRGAKSATFTTWASGSCWSAPTASAPSTGCCHGHSRKGRLLTQIAAFWFGQLGEPNHLITTDVERIDLPPGADPRVLAGRSTLCRKTQVAPIECVVRGYLAGSGWQEYQEERHGLRTASSSRIDGKLPDWRSPFSPRRPRPPAGHDENISFERMVELVGRDRAGELRRRSLTSSAAAPSTPASRILSPTRSSSGADRRRRHPHRRRLTPDSSRFWPAIGTPAGRGQPSFDKQFVRDWLSRQRLGQEQTPPALPAEIVAKTRAEVPEGSSEAHRAEICESGGRAAPFPSSPPER